jgi:hypothetical protein
VYDENHGFFKPLEVWPQESWGGQGNVNFTGTAPIMGGMIAPRDFVTFGFHYADDGGQIGISAAVDWPEKQHPGAVLRKKAEKATQAFFGMICDRIAGADTTVRGGVVLQKYRVYYMVQVDIHLSRMIPKNMILSGTVKDLAAFLQYLSEFDWSTVREHLGTLAM